MNFDEAGLPPIQLVQDAFNFSFAYVKSGYSEVLKDFKRQITRIRDANIKELDEAHRQKEITEEEYTRHMIDNEESFKQQMKLCPTYVSNELKKRFAYNHLIPARILFKNSETSGPEVLAALLLAQCVRSPKDYKEIEKTFGPVVGDLVAELIHIERYTEQRNISLGEAAPDIKRAYAVQLMVSMMSAAEQADLLLKRGRQPSFSQNYEEDLFETIKLMWGTDATLDAHLVALFNKAVALVSSPVRLADQDGNLRLVPYTPPAPPKPPNNGGNNLPVVRKPPNNGSIGPDVF